MLEFVERAQESKRGVYSGLILKKWKVQKERSIESAQRVNGRERE